MAESCGQATEGRLPTTVVVAVLLGLLFAVAAFAGTVIYNGSSPINPGGYYQTNGWANRDWNAACRVGNSGQMSVQYLNTSNNIVASSGAAWTNCSPTPPITVRLDNNGYYKSRCTNAGTVAFTVACQTYTL